jgi:hypothetical protein
MSVILEIGAAFLLFVFLITIVCAVGAVIDDKDYKQAKALLLWTLIIFISILILAYTSYLIR